MEAIHADPNHRRQSADATPKNEDGHGALGQCAPPTSQSGLA